MDALGLLPVRNLHGEQHFRTLPGRRIATFPTVDDRDRRRHRHRCGHHSDDCSHCDPAEKSDGNEEVRSPLLCLPYLQKLKYGCSEQHGHCSRHLNGLQHQYRYVVRRFRRHSRKLISIFGRSFDYVRGTAEDEIPHY